MNPKNRDRRSSTILAIAIRLQGHCIVELEMETANAFGIRHGEILHVELTNDGLLLHRENPETEKIPIHSGEQ